MLRFLGVVGAVLLLFGLASYLLTAEFDLWTAIHVTGGGILLAASAILEFSRLRAAVRAPAFRRGATAVAAGVLFGAILVVVNLLAARLDWTYDATERRVHTLSAWSLEVLATLSEPVEILAFLEPGDPALDATRRLLDRYESGGDLLRWSWIDPARHPDLARRHDVNRSGVLVAVRGETTARTVIDPSWGPDETLVTPLLLRVTDPFPRRVAFTAGHGEADPMDLDDPSAAGALSRSLAAGNVPVGHLLLDQPVPDDVALVVVAGPTSPLPSSEVDRIAAHVARGGGALVLAEVGATSGLERWLAAYGLSAGEDLVVDPAVTRWGGSPLGMDPVVSDLDREHPALDGFRGRILLHRTRSVELAADDLPPGARGRVLAWTSGEAWAETSLDTVLEGRPPRRDPGERRGPLPVVVAVTTPGGGRIILAGDSDFLRNAHVLSFQNLDFAMRAVRWLIGAEDPAIPEPRRLRASRLDLTSAGLRNLFRLAVLLYPEALLILGLGVWWWRRGL